ncbi:MAG: hypothetical protein HRT45_18300 [Bdellovibrionales bacterium]|nr:hypothetical protein [Bdellovibrionales bacterium]
MRENALVAANYFVFLLITAILVAFQCALWFQFLGSFPPPQMWIPTLVFWFLYREPIEGVAMAYLLSGLLATQTSLPFSSFLTLNLLLFAVAFLLKQRFYWAGVSFYTSLCGACTFLFLVFEYLLIRLLDSDFTGFPEVLSWLLTPLLTMAFALPLYFLFHSLDKVCEKVQPREVTGGVH